jgi:hypothetical protein
VCGESIFFSEKMVLSSDLLGFSEKFMWQDSSRVILLPLRKKWLLYELDHHLPSDLVRNLKLTHLRPFAGSRCLGERTRGNYCLRPFGGSSQPLSVLNYPSSSLQWDLMARLSLLTRI